jgi:hypothetical protein
MNALDPRGRSILKARGYVTTHETRADLALRYKVSVYAIEHWEHAALHDLFAKFQELSGHKVVLS